MPAPAHYAVSDGLLAGAYPSTADAVAALEREGATVFVDLTHPSDPLDDYGHLLDGSRRLSYPIPDMGTPAARAISSSREGDAQVTVGSKPSSRHLRSA